MLLYRSAAINTDMKASIYMSTSLDYHVHVHVPSDVLVQLVLEVNEAVVAGLGIFIG